MKKTRRETSAPHKNIGRPVNNTPENSKGNLRQSGIVGGEKERS